MNIFRSPPSGSGNILFPTCVRLSISLSDTNLVNAIPHTDLAGSLQVYYQGLKMCITFGCNLRINFVTFFSQFGLSHCLGLKHLDTG